MSFHHDATKAKSVESGRETSANRGQPIEWDFVQFFAGLPFALAGTRIQRSGRALALLELPGCTRAAIARSDSVVSRRNRAPIASFVPCVLPQSPEGQHPRLK